MKKINIGLIGAGTIGSGVVSVLNEKAQALRKAVSTEFEISCVCDIDTAVPQRIHIDKDIFTTNVRDILENDSIQVVIELIGGIHPAKEYILEALNKKKYVITANKALLAEEGDEIFENAQNNGVGVYFEGSVGGGIPVVKVLREGYISNQVESIFGIINGTSNYILSQMALKGCDFKHALAEAQRKGYAESNSTLDINGTDSAHKIAILSRLSFGQGINFRDVYIEGINEIELNDIRYADELGFSIKLLAIAKKVNNALQLRVHPTLLPKKHLLANVHGVFNAIFINADLVGESLLHGEGAGKLPTASAVMSDLVSIAQSIGHDKKEQLYDEHDRMHEELKVCSIDDIETRYYIRFSAVDEPAVLSKIAKILGDKNISIHSVIQKGRRQAHAVPIVMMTHDAKEKNLREALRQIDNLPVIKKKSIAIRVERL